MPPKKISMSFPSLFRFAALICALFVSISYSFGMNRSFQNDASGEKIDCIDLGNGETKLYIDMGDNQGIITVVIPTPEVLEDRIKEIMEWDFMIENAFLNIVDVDADGNVIRSDNFISLDLDKVDEPDMGFIFIEINGDVHFSGRVGDRYYGEISDDKGLSNMAAFAAVLDNILGTALADMVNDLTMFGINVFGDAFSMANNNMADDYAESFENSRFTQTDGDDSDWSDSDFEDFVSGGWPDFWDWLMGHDDETPDPYNGN